MAGHHKWPGLARSTSFTKPREHDHAQARKAPTTTTLGQKLVASQKSRAIPEQTERRIAPGPLAPSRQRRHHRAGATTQRGRRAPSPWNTRRVPSPCHGAQNDALVPGPHPSSRQGCIPAFHCVRITLDIHWSAHPVARASGALATIQSWTRGLRPNRHRVEVPP